MYFILHCPEKGDLIPISGKDPFQISRKLGKVWFVKLGKLSILESKHYLP